MVITIAQPEHLAILNWKLFHSHWKTSTVSTANRSPYFSQKLHYSVLHLMNPGKLKRMISKNNSKNALYEPCQAKTYLWVSLGFCDQCMPRSACTVLSGPTLFNTKSEKTSSAPKNKFLIKFQLPTWAGKPRIYTAGNSQRFLKVGFCLTRLLYSSHTWSNAKNYTCIKQNCLTEIYILLINIS